MKGEVGFLPKLVVGLGNPGRAYAMTRHNMGFLVIQALASQQGATLRSSRQLEGSKVRVAIEQTILELFLPETFMNESGRAVKKILTYFNWQPNNLLVVVDDMALPFGQMRLKAYGSAGGHNGLKSIERELGTSHYARLRIGIGAAPFSHIDHVLGTFTKEESELLPEVINRAVSAIKRLIFEDFAYVAGEVNRREGQDI
jgi:peptidyl-tRNA hydrolase, PTH1 family